MKKVTWSNDFLAKVLCINGKINNVSMNENGDITITYAPSGKRKSKGSLLFESKEALSKTDEIFKGSK